MPGQDSPLPAAPVNPPAGFSLPGTADPKESVAQHLYDDLDQTPNAHHHTIGKGPTQAAAGNHSHDGLMPVGAVITYASDDPPDGWLLCDGGSFSSTDYPALAALLGGTTTPDLRRRFILGADPGAATPVGLSGGSQKITIPNLPSHNHGGVTGNDSPDHTHNIIVRNNYAGGNQAGGLGVYYNDGVMTTQGANNRHTHSVSAEGGGTDYWPRYYVLTYIIKAG